MAILQFFLSLICGISLFFTIGFLYQRAATTDGLTSLESLLSYSCDSHNFDCIDKLARESESRKVSVPILNLLLVISSGIMLVIFSIMNKKGVIRNLSQSLSSVVVITNAIITLLFAATSLSCLKFKPLQWPFLALLIFSLLFLLYAILLFSIAFSSSSSHSTTIPFSESSDRLSMEYEYSEQSCSSCLLRCCPCAQSLFSSSIASLFFFLCISLSLVGLFIVSLLILIRMQHMENNILIGNNDYLTQLKDVYDVVNDFSEIDRNQYVTRLTTDTLTLGGINGFLLFVGVLCGIVSFLYQQMTKTDARRFNDLDSEETVLKNASHDVHEKNVREIPQKHKKHHRKKKLHHIDVV
eukprot:MONOS_1820.1-p1 / transcript=MONOS_1820.1 / gene=MONOS_1820 / organism=Monocercomonoides_exilis_PA203 / gene_product=unspecified product / transcript_product=unspecified product / location=Mono_scaffold00034:96423-98190(+) / protein_length=354 / sequence_SO=supercontig / SO=protein_coding / is_pseudo=false